MDNSLALSCPGTGYCLINQTSIVVSEEESSASSLYEGTDEEEEDDDDEDGENDADADHNDKAQGIINFKIIIANVNLFSVSLIDKILCSSISCI